MTDAEPRRSRFGWPTATEPTTTPAGTHDHRLKNTPLGAAFVGIVLLFLVSVGLVAYMMVARESRNEQNERTNQRINDAICDLLDQLPEDGFLNRPRAKYGCGPGIPIDQLTPQEQAQLNGSARPSVVTPPASQAAPPPVGAPAVPNPPRTAPASPPQTSGAEPVAPSIPRPTPEPGLLDPVTDPLCQSLSICL